MNLTTFRVWCYACEKEVFLKQRLAAPLAGPSPKFSEQVRGCRGVSAVGSDVLGAGPCDPGVGGAGIGGSQMASVPGLCSQVPANPC